VLSVAASTIPGEYLLPQLLAAFRSHYPQIEVELSIADSAAVAASLLADETDVGMIGASIDQPGLRLEALEHDQIVLAVPAEHPFAGREKITVEELVGQPLILREAGSGTRLSVEAALAAGSSRLPQADVALTLGSSQSILQAVSRGLGLGFVSARAAAPLQANGQLACVELEGVDLCRSLYLAYLPKRAADPTIARFLDFARDQFDE
jgi:DNA-binding transcriptional LysR family regulator